MTARSVLITGASSGFGRNAALDLAAAGWRVFAGMRDVAKGESMVAQHSSIVPLALDVDNGPSIDKAVERVLHETGGTIDALLGNAGYGLMGAFEDLSDAECRRQMETNFFGTLAVTRAVLPAMRAQQCGRTRS